METFFFMIIKNKVNKSNSFYLMYFDWKLNFVGRAKQYNVYNCILKTVAINSFIWQTKRKILQHFPLGLIDEKRILVQKTSSLNKRWKINETINVYNNKIFLVMINYLNSDVGFPPSAIFIFFFLIMTNTNLDRFYL